MELLTCTKCKERKAATQEFFPKNSRKKNSLDSWCRECRSRYRKASRIPAGIIDIEKARQARILKECVICGDTSSRQLAIDHDHTSGLVRGALCSRCNLGLGHFRDDPTLLRFAALYLEGKCACGACQPIWGGKAKA